jgi:hypothetical protein
MLKEEHLKKYPDFIYTRRSKAELAEAKKSSKLGRKSKSSEVIMIATATATATVHHSNHGEEEKVLFNHSRPQVDLVLINNNNNTTQQAQPTQNTTKKRSRKSMSNNGQKDPRGRKKKRHKHPFAPKHPMSAYLYYLASVYPIVSLNFPGSTVGPISKSISKTWHAMSNEERLPWKQKAESDKARYAREMQIYMAEQQQQQQQQQQQVIKEEEEAAAALAEDGEEEEEEEEEEQDGDVDIQTLAAVVNMVNSGGSSSSNNRYLHQSP